MKRLLGILLLIGGYTVSVGNTPDPYEWEKDRKRYALSAQEEELSELVLKEHSRYEYALEDNKFYCYITTHRIVRVNNDEAVQRNNRIYISMTNAFDLTKLQARTITRTGKVVSFDQNNLKEIKDEEKGREYKIFAMEGIELGSEIEYYYTRKMAGRIFDRIYLQSGAPMKEASFFVSCPGHLKFDFKPYEDALEVTKKESSEINTYEGLIKNVEALEEEPFSQTNANRKRVEFKLAYNTARSHARLYTWDDAAKTFYPRLYEVSKSDEKLISKFINTLNDNPSLDKEARIKNIEQKIKSSVTVNRDRKDENLDNIEPILKSRIASQEGITKLFISVFNQLGITCHAVITCSREDTRFDKDFDTWAYLDDFILYFPQTEGYLAPYTFETRYPLIPYLWTAQDALFIEPFIVGDLKSALASVNSIPAADYLLNKDDLQIDVAFNNDLSSNDIVFKREFSGYNATYMAPYYEIMTEEQRKKLVMEIVNQTAADLKLKTWSAKPLTDRKVLNFQVEAAFPSDHFLEVAGPRIIFKVGELIGPQVEMYRDDKRYTRIENDYNRGYDRTIRVTIPEGYSIKNPNDLAMDIRFKAGDQEPFLFQSEYTLKGNLLEVKVREYYKEIFVSKERYEDFRKVINAAADFNKIKLVLERKN